MIDIASQQGSLIAINALATRAGGAAVRVGEVARRAPRIWGARVLLLHNRDAGIAVDASRDRIIAGWPHSLAHAPPVARRVLEPPVLRRHFGEHRPRAILHYGTYVPLDRTKGALNVLCFISLAPWDRGPASRSFRNRTLRWLFERTHRRADVIVVQSAATRDFLAELYPQTVTRLAVVHNGLALPSLIRPPQRSGFLLLGDIYDYRRVDDVVRAHARLGPAIGAAHPLTIAGDLTRDRAATQRVYRAIQDSGSANVKLCGLVVRKSALEMLAACRAFVSYASVENGPNALIEATALDTPAILSDIPPHREFAAPTTGFARDAKQLTELLHAAALTEPPSLPARSQSVDTWNMHVARLGAVLEHAGALDRVQSGSMPAYTDAHSDAEVRP